MSAIARRAASLDDLAATVPVATTGAVAPWIERWSRTVADGDVAGFERRLVWDGWRADQLGWLLAEPPPPAWAELLAEVLALPPDPHDVLGPFHAAALRRLTPAGRAFFPGFGLGRFTAPLLPGEGLAEACERLPVLARLLATATLDQVAQANEVGDRLAGDRPALEALFGPLGDLAGVTTGLSDPHDGGRTVWRLVFTTGRELFYKPRSLAIDQAFASLAAWLHGRGASLELRVPRTLARDGYGWAEGVAQAPCADLAGVGRFYRRMGMLLALVYALGGGDLHAENLIAVGEHPMAIDLETLLQPGFEEPEPYTVLQTLLLRSARPGLGGQVEEVGAMADAFDGRHRARLGLDAVPPSDHAADVLAGFEEAYRLLLRHRDGFPLHAFAALPMRFLFRGTVVYGKLLRSCMQPERLAHGLAHSFALDRLCRPFVRQEERPARWGLLAAERRALERHDVPRFTMASDETWFARSPWQRAADHLAALDERDLGRQRELIALALASDRPPPPAGPAGSFLDEAVAIADLLASRAVAAPEGRTVWLADLLRPQLGAAMPGALGPGLMDGSAGLALFFGALYARTGSRRHRELALAAIAPAREAPPLQLALGIGTSGSSGLASVAYALAHLAGWLQLPALLDEARACAGAIPAGALAATRLSDVLGGLAGTLLALLAVPGDAALALATRAGEVLLARQTAAGGWPTEGGHQLAGFSHGAGGIAMALGRLALATGDERFAAAARAGWAYEDTVFEPDAANWRVLALPAPGFMTSWCHGAPGVALARLPGPADHLEAALATTAGAQPGQLDFLCCGNFGRVEVLLAAGRGDDASALAVRRLEARAWRDAEGRTSRLGHNPTFLRGLAGIGYTLLRLEDPSLPCLLAWATSAKRP